MRHSVPLRPSWSKLTNVSWKKFTHLRLISSTRGKNARRARWKKTGGSINVTETTNERRSEFVSRFPVQTADNSHASLIFIKTKIRSPQFYAWEDKYVSAWAETRRNYFALKMKNDCRTFPGGNLWLWHNYFQLKSGCLEVGDWPASFRHVRACSLNTALTVGVNMSDWSDRSDASPWLNASGRAVRVYEDNNSITLMYSRLRLIFTSINLLNGGHFLIIREYRPG